MADIVKDLKEYKKKRTLLEAYTVSIGSPLARAQPGRSSAVNNYMLKPTKIYDRSEIGLLSRERALGRPCVLLRAASSDIPYGLRPIDRAS